MPILEPAFRNFRGLMVSLTLLPMAPVAFLATLRVEYAGGAFGLNLDLCMRALVGASASTLIQL